MISKKYYALSSHPRNFIPHKPNPYEALILHFIILPNVEGFKRAISKAPVTPLVVFAQNMMTQSPDYSQVGKVSHRQIGTLLENSPYCKRNGLKPFKAYTYYHQSPLYSYYE